MNIIKKITPLIISLILFTNALQISAANLNDAFTGSKLDGMAGKMGYNKTTNSDILIGTIINAFLSILGIIFLVLMLYGGYLWMTDRGNEDSVNKAKNVIQAAVIGLIIVLFSFSISYFVITKLGNATLTGSE